MLSKTTWALTKGNDSLAGKAFKAKYGNFLNSSNRSLASPIWKGLQWCKETIQVSTCCTVGSGSTISAWFDPWIPSMDNHKPSPRLNVLQDPALKVHHLMFFNPKRWNIPLLTTLFEQDTVHNILKIHLSQADFEDSATWTPSSSGKHSVKSFYLTDQHNRFQDHSDIVWKAIWNLKIHERFKLHLLRIGSESLPWFSEVDAPCPLCQTSSDTLDHLYGDCIFYRVAWRESPWDLQSSILPSASVKDLINFVACPPSTLLPSFPPKVEFSLYASITIYLLWNSRNDVLHIGRPADLNVTIKKIKRSFVEHSQIGHLPESHPLQLSASQIPTGPEWDILTIDAAWNCNRSCLAGTMQHPNDPPILSWFQVSNEEKPLQAEAKAALLALSIAGKNGSTKIWLRSDALQLVDAILHPCNSPWEIRSIIVDIISALNFFSSWACSWIPRSENVLAHDLSQYGSKSNFPSLCYFQGYPDLRHSVTGTLH
ncbi:uncharacterized protein LOC116214473 [Punica granatum]|uniref:Uncharacterized protein LOC116214473 n=1 Tax=Punica granatum TaxID=22663 RepID=A0A6P8EGY2_PUNGR|nr:uncharacterized protein LOC116214473 [Punica granatum]